MSAIKAFSTASGVSGTTDIIDTLQLPNEHAIVALSYFGPQVWPALSQVITSYVGGLGIPCTASPMVTSNDASVYEAWIVVRAMATQGTNVPATLKQDVKKVLNQAGFNDPQYKLHIESGKGKGRPANIITDAVWNYYGKDGLTGYTLPMSFNGSAILGSAGLKENAKASVKHLTCWYWKHQIGGCNKTDDTCLYAHTDTGRDAEKPRSLLPGVPAMAGKNADRIEATIRTGLAAQAATIPATPVGVFQSGNIPGTPIGSFNTGGIPITPMGSFHAGNIPAPFVGTFKSGATSAPLLSSFQSTAIPPTPAGSFQSGTDSGSLLNAGFYGIQTTVGGAGSLHSTSPGRSPLTTRRGLFDSRLVPASVERRVLEIPHTFDAPLSARLDRLEEMAAGKAARNGGYGINGQARGPPKTFAMDSTNVNGLRLASNYYATPDGGSPNSRSYALAIRSPLPTSPLVQVPGLTEKSATPACQLHTSPVSRMESQASSHVLDSTTQALGAAAAARVETKVTSAHLQLAARELCKAVDKDLEGLDKIQSDIYAFKQLLAELSLGAGETVLDVKDELRTAIEKISAEVACILVMNKLHRRRAESVMQDESAARDIFEWKKIESAAVATLAATVGENTIPGRDVGVDGNDTDGSDGGVKIIC